MKSFLPALTLLLAPAAPTHANPDAFRERLADPATRGLAMSAEVMAKRESPHLPGPW